MPDVVTVSLPPPLASRVAWSYARGQGFAELIRPQSSRISAGIFLAAAVGADIATAAIVGGLGLIVSGYGLAAVLNDLADVETDRLNGRDRPLATGVLTSADAWATALACGVLAIASQLLLAQPVGLLVTAAAVAVSATYSFGPRLQRRGIVVHATLAVSYLILPLVLAASQSSTRPQQLVSTMAILVLSGTGVLLYKDLKDEAGDRATGKRTPLVRWGRRRMETVAIVLVAASTVVGLLLVPGWWLAPMLVAVALQLVHRQRSVGLTWLRNSWYVSCVLLVL